MQTYVLDQQLAAREVPVLRVFGQDVRPIANITISAHKAIVAFTNDVWMPDNGRIEQLLEEQGFRPGHIQRNEHYVLVGYHREARAR